MTRILLVITFLLCSNFQLNAQNFLWAKSLGGNKSDYSASIAIDGSNNVYTTGYFLGTADFNPGAGAANLISTGQSDIYISKLDASGNFLWAKRIGGNSYDDATGIAIDGSGNIYITGHFSGTVDFDPGAGTSNLTSTGDYDIFICKLDQSGNFLWAKRIGNNNGDYSWGIVIDAMDNSYITGQFFGTVDFNPGPGTANKSSSGSYDFFILKLDASGNYLWANSLGGLNPDVAYAVTVDAAGNVFTTGGFNGSVDFDPGAGAFTLSSSGSEDVFVLKLDAMGNFVWAKSFGGNNFDSANAIAVDALGNVYTLGTFEGTADFDPNATTFNITSSGFYDVFVSRLDNSGNLIWARNLNGTDYEDAFSIDTDVNGNVVFSGCFSSVVDFNPGAGVFNLTPSGLQDIFVSMLDNSGNFLWAIDLKGSNNIGCGISIQVDASNNIYTTGFFSSTVDFDQDASIFNITATGQEDIFIHKMNYLNTPLPVELISFTGRSVENTTLLNWSTATETNNDYFHLIRSTTGQDFEIIATVNGAGNSTQTINYSYIDKEPFNGINYYQLQQIDFDGETTFSKIIAVKHTTDNMSLVTISPNPANNFIRLNVEDNTTISQIEISNSTGEMVFRTGPVNLIDISRLANGLYYLSITTDEKRFTGKFIKQ
jgi:Secretion system C-terminal sorting domain/Beta-propeller repeat